MSSIKTLKSNLKAYWQLPYHNNPALADKLLQVQKWQRKRIFKTHSQLFALPQNQDMANYFVNDLYGGANFYIMAKQLETILPKAKLFETFIPKKALETGTLGIYAAIEAIELDLQLAKWLQDNNLSVEHDNMLKSYQAVNAKNARKQQIATMKQMCYRTDKYINAFVLQKAFSLAKNTAYKQGLQPLYDFVDTGFVAMRQLTSIADFIEPFANKELAIIEQVHNTNHNNKVDPFNLNFNKDFTQAL